jgi:hypothetical protein
MRDEKVCACARACALLLIHAILHDQFWAGLWSHYAKLLTLTPQFVKLQLRLLHKISLCINNGKPIRHFITTT